MSNRIANLVAGLAASICLIVPGFAEAEVRALSADRGTYVDTVELSKKAELIVLARVTHMEPVTPANSGSLSPVHRRYYAEANTRALLYGQNGIGGSLRYLVDLPADASPSAADLTNKDIFLFASHVPGRPAELKLVEPTAQQLWSPERESRLRAVLRSLVSPRRSAPVTRVRELAFVPGSLAGEGLTQIFLDTKKGRATISVRHQPDNRKTWGVSFTEVAGRDPLPPAQETLEWYDLACFLPPSPPQSAYVSGTFAAKQQAYSDYRMVLASLGPCERS
ncbi:MAG: hypothetical protein K0R64_3270 [Novosphingobium lindaniclasticum]|jgi:hypothetical protein|uniref:hypothetical protein n=1 Tax=Novosphingobium lindaniclasticum TaxID=1329895 RepID=UPI002409F0E1|nr:hypothetical protein [Novosphingobium lindaniclasticum]MDF2640286.1 hypothetical protein [Novosphingobium lindaniclasticum]